MDTWQILCTLRDVTSFLDVFPSDLLPPSRPVLKPCTHHQCRSPYRGRFTLASHTSYTPLFECLFRFIWHLPLVFSIQTLLHHNCTIWEYKKRQLQGLTSEVCGQYCCLFALYMDRGYTPQQFITLFAGRSNADRLVKQFSRLNLGPPCRVAAWINAAAAAYKR